MSKNTPIKPYSFILNPDPSKIDLSVTEKYIKDKMENGSSFGIDNLTQYGIYKLQGYAYDCKHFLKRYVYKQHGSWSEAYALNKNNLKKHRGYNIAEIIEIIKSK